MRPDNLGWSKLRILSALLLLELGALVGLDGLGGLDLDGLDHLDVLVLVQLQQLPYTPENNSIHPTVLVDLLHLMYTWESYWIKVLVQSHMFHLLVILHSGHLGKSSLAEFTAVRLFPSVTSHVTLKAGGLLQNCYWYCYCCKVVIDHDNVDKDVWSGRGVFKI